MTKELKKALRQEITGAVQVVLGKHNQKAAVKITKAVTSAAKSIAKKFLKSQKELSTVAKAKTNTRVAKKKTKKSAVKSKK